MPLVICSQRASAGHRAPDSDEPGLTSQSMGTGSAAPDEIPQGRASSIGRYESVQLLACS
jgi:hypothetical protein